jgi:uncharacterized protein DUF1707/cell wall-active antibiotic response 4TMS protein YvqF
MSSERVVPAAASAPPSSEEKERVVQALCVHFASDHLSMDELEDRLGSAYHAQSGAQLERLVADLPSLSGDPVGSASDPLLARTSEVPPRGEMAAVMGSSDRKGSWFVPRHLKVFAFMGSARLDLREARLAQGITEIEIVSVMGAVEIIVPPGVRVETVGAAFLGTFETAPGDSATLNVAQPVVRISGFALMAAVETKVRRRNRRLITDD